MPRTGILVLTCLLIFIFLASSVLATVNWSPGVLRLLMLIIDSIIVVLGCWGLNKFYSNGDVRLLKRFAILIISLETIFMVISFLEDAILVELVKILASVALIISLNNYRKKTEIKVNP